MKMEQTECSEMAAYKIQMLGNYPEESIQRSEYCKSLKSRIKHFLLETLREAALQFEVDHILPVGRMFDPPGVNYFSEHLPPPKSNPRHGAAYVQIKQNLSDENGD
jgi:hypothetical protein